METTILDTIDMHRLGLELQRARKRAKITQEDAAKVIGVVRTTLTAIENGKRRVTAKELITLARAYGRSVHELVRPRPNVGHLDVQFRGPLFRNEEDALAIAPMVEEFEDLCTNYLDLEIKTGSPLVCIYPSEYLIANQPIDETAESIALDERNRLGLGDGPIPALRPLFENDVGLRIFFLPLAEGFSEIYTFTDELGGCLAVNSVHPETRRRWSLAHGYFHFLATRRQAIITQEWKSRASENERFADAFARNFLMPTAGLTRRFNDAKRAGIISPTTLCTMAYYYGVSHEALVRRLEGVHLVPAGTAEKLKHFKWSELQQQLGLVAPMVDSQKLPIRYQSLALEAYQASQVSEGEFARLLEVDRFAAREFFAVLKREPHENTQDDPGDAENGTSLWK